MATTIRVARVFGQDVGSITHTITHDSDGITIDAPLNDFISQVISAIPNRLLARRSTREADIRLAIDQAIAMMKDSTRFNPPTRTP